jgi:hypothetical protein
LVNQKILTSQQYGRTKLFVNSAYMRLLIRDSTSK